MVHQLTDLELLCETFEIHPPVNDAVCEATTVPDASPLGPAVTAGIIGEN